MRKKGSQRTITFTNPTLVVRREDVQAEVKTLRVQWHIPENGFTNSKDYQQWLDQLTESLIATDNKPVNITEQDLFVDEKNQLQPLAEVNKVVIPPSAGLSQYSLFLSDIYKLCSRLSYDQYWATFFQRYVTQGKIMTTYEPRLGITKKTPHIKIIRRSIEGGEYDYKIQLEFGANTEQKDVTAVWHEVKKRQKLLPRYQRTRNSSKQDRDLLLLEEYMAGKKPLEIYQDLPQSAIFDDIEPAAIIKAIQRGKKKLKGQ